MMGGLKLPRAGKKSLLGEESLDDGLDDWECGDMGLANGEQAWCSEGMRRERAVAEADLITLLTGRVVRFSIESPESSR